MKYKIIATILFIISSIAFLMCLIALYTYFSDYTTNHAGGAELLSGIKGIGVISAIFFFTGKILWKKMEAGKFSELAIKEREKEADSKTETASLQD